MVAKGRGAIVNVSSQASQVGLQDHTAYCVSKGALDQLTRMMAVELGPKKVMSAFGVLYQFFHHFKVSLRNG
jgi:NAD(P)-dependent dehydrogenase (short-subunit alcohol dehydrogenase family)